MNKLSDLSILNIFEYIDYDKNTSINFIKLCKETYSFTKNIFFTKNIYFTNIEKIKERHWAKSFLNISKKLDNLKYFDKIKIIKYDNVGESFLKTIYPKIKNYQVRIKYLTFVSKSFDKIKVEKNIWIDKIVVKVLNEKFISNNKFFFKKTKKLAIESYFNDENELKYFNENLELLDICDERKTLVRIDRSVSMSKIISENYKNLQVLRISEFYGTSVEKIDYISKIKTLKKLDLYGTSLSKCYLNKIAEMENLEELIISSYIYKNNFLIESLKVFKKLKKLKILGIDRDVRDEIIISKELDILKKNTQVFKEYESLKKFNLVNLHDPELNRKSIKNKKGEKINIGCFYWDITKIN